MERRNECRLNTLITLSMVLLLLGGRSGVAQIVSGVTRTTDTKAGVQAVTMQFSGPLVSLTQAKVVVKLPDGDKTFSFNANTRFCADGYAVRWSALAKVSDITVEAKAGSTVATALHKGLFNAASGKPPCVAKPANLATPSAPSQAAAPPPAPAPPPRPVTVVSGSSEVQSAPLEQFELVPGDRLSGITVQRNMGAISVYAQTPSTGEAWVPATASSFAFVRIDLPEAKAVIRKNANSWTVAAVARGASTILLIPRELLPCTVEVGGQ